MKDNGMGQAVISETKDYAMLVGFFIANGLEFSAEIEVPTDLVKCWKAIMGGRLAGGCVLAMREGRFICDGIATDPAVRGMGIGERLLQIMLDEARERGAKELYLVARAPGFFAKHGFIEISRDDAPRFFECFSCPQYGVDCHPKVMKRKLAD